MQRINLKNAMILWILTATLTVVHVGVQAALLKENEDHAVHALFDLTSPTRGPFPSDRFTVADPSHNTDRRVNLPLPDCSVRPSDCEDLDVINTLDGFNLQPRLSIPFDGPIDVNSVTSETLFLISLGDTLDPHDRGGKVVGINQIVWDVATNMLHVESDELLDQHTRYALIVTDGVRDPQGRPIEATEAFRRFRHDLNFAQRPARELEDYREALLDLDDVPFAAHSERLKGYRKALLYALQVARSTGVEESDIVCASVFTAQSATAVLEKIRDQIKAATPAPADFRLGAGGTRTVFDLSKVSGINWNQQTGDNPPRFTTAPVNIGLLRIVPGAVGQVAFGKYVSPDYLVHPGQFIPSVGTRTGTPLVRGVNEIYFTLVLPSGRRPEDGWPVAIYGHGSQTNKDAGGGVPNVAASMASQGIATIGINVVAHGFGALGTLAVNQVGGAAVTFPSGGRGLDQDGDGIIGNREGIWAAPPQTIIDNRDTILQMVGDLMQMVRVIQVGMDADGDGARDLDANRIYYFGQSLGGIYGTAFLAVELSVRAGVPNVPAGPFVEQRRLSPPSRPLMASLLAARQLLNGPAITSIAGVLTPGPHFFHENMPLRDGAPVLAGLEDGTTRVIRSPLINDVPGAIEIQRFFENMEWVMQSGGPVAYAPHLRKAPLAGVPPKSVIIQFAKGDQTSTNPTTTTILRAGDLADRATYYRHDLAYAERPTLPKNPHGFMVGIGAAGGFLEIGLPAQGQIATFFASDGTVIIHPEPARFFEVPIKGPLPEDLNYIP